MPHSLSLTDGATTISLSTYSASEGVMLRAYVPRDPSFDANAGAYAPVTEEVGLFIFDTTAAQAQDRLRGIERLCYTALQRAATGRGPKVYLQYQLSSDGAAWRSEVLDARLQPDRSAPQTLPQGKIAATLLLTRVPYWEGARTALSLTNGNGTSSSGLTIRNHNDSGTGHDNWATVASAVEGSVPAPLEIRLKNTSGAARSFINFFCANDPWGGTAHILEGEAASGVTVGASATCSNGQYGQRSGAGTQAWAWTVPGAVLDVFGGRKARVVARFASLDSSDHEMRLRLYDPSGLQEVGPPNPITIAEFGTNFLQDCGVVALPPDANATGFGDMRLQLELYAATGITTQLDFVQLTPAEPGCLRHIRQRGMQLEANETLIDDPYDGVIYSLNVSSQRFGGIFAPYSEPLLLYPGATNRLLFLWDFTTYGSVGVDTTLQVSAFYRPRRLTL